MYMSFPLTPVVLSGVGGGASGPPGPTASGAGQLDPLGSQPPTGDGADGEGFQILLAIRQTIQIKKQRMNSYTGINQSKTTDNKTTNQFPHSNLQIKNIQIIKQPINFHQKQPIN